jgi:hypothetical protein
MTAAQTEPFVPLTSAVPKSGERQEYSVTVLAQSERTETFKLLESAPPAAAGSATVRHGKTCEPQVAIQREGDQVSGIRIQCGCGQVIELACVYQAEARSEK